MRGGGGGGGGLRAAAMRAARDGCMPPGISRGGCCRRCLASSCSPFMTCSARPVSCATRSPSRAHKGLSSGNCTCSLAPDASCKQDTSTPNTTGAALDAVLEVCALSVLQRLRPGQLLCVAESCWLPALCGRWWDSCRRDVPCYVPCTLPANKCEVVACCHDLAMECQAQCSARVTHLAIQQEETGAGHASCHPTHLDALQRNSTVRQQAQGLTVAQQQPCNMLVHARRRNCLGCGAGCRC